MMDRSTINESSNSGVCFQRRRIFLSVYAYIALIMFPQYLEKTDHYSKVKIRQSECRENKPQGSK